MGCSQGAFHSCDYSDIWVRDIIEKHLATKPVEIVGLSIYRDDGKDILKNKDDLEDYKEHLTTLHHNLIFTTRSCTEGEYLDLWLMLRDRKIEWKTYSKTPPVYLHRQSCHDQNIFKGIFKGVALRIR